MVDGDEAVPPELVAEMKKVVASGNNEATIYRMRRKDFFLGKWIKRSSGYPTWFGRLMKVGHVRVERSINEDKGTPWQELETRNCGWWVDIGVEPLAKVLTEAMNLSEEERHAMGRRGRRLVEQNYSWDRIGRDMVAVYEWVLGGGEVPACVITD
ncbi:MAG: hypothetical protein U9P36_00915 [Thermodesulfobacteriota bacterium]|nr:hypothetical protein [Thermodesulfobacteriota bacterium]